MYGLRSYDLPHSAPVNRPRSTALALLVVLVAGRAAMAPPAAPAAQDSYAETGLERLEDSFLDAPKETFKVRERNFESYEQN